MVSCQVVMDALERIAPKRLAEEWDNPGLLVGALNQDIRKIMVCLDVSDHVVFLHKGLIEEEGPPDQLFREPRTDRLRQFLSATMAV